MARFFETLAATTLFNGWNYDAFHECFDQTDICFFGKGELLVNESDPCTKIGLIIDGQLTAQKYSSVGDCATLDLMGAGDIFGEDLIFSNKKTYSNTIEAATNAKVIFISRDIFMMLLDRSPAIMQNLLMILSDRIISQNRRICLLAQKSLRYKIASYLLELLHDQAKSEDSRRGSTNNKVSTQAVELPVSKEVVSRLLAIPRPSFSRELIRMAFEGLIRVSGRVIWLLDMERLESGVLDGFPMV